MHYAETHLKQPTVGLQTQLLKEQPLKKRTLHEKLTSTQTSSLLFDNLPHSKIFDLIPLKTLLRTSLAIPHEWHAHRQVHHKRRTSLMKKKKNKERKSLNKQSVLVTQALHS